MMGLWFLAPLALAAAGAINRRQVKRAVEQEYLDRYPRRSDGIADGAEGFTLTGTNGRGVLMLHGFGDTPQSLRYLGARLHSAGYTVHAPLLPGHGRSPAAFAAAREPEYHEVARRALGELRASTKRVSVLGLSMGGALAAALANEAPDVRALVLLAAYLVPPAPVRLARSTAPLWSPLFPYIRSKGDASVHDRIASQATRSYGSLSAGALDALVATAATGLKALPLLRVPTLVINSEQDNRIPRESATRAIRELTAPAEVHWVTNCGHVITVDYCRDAVATLVLTFLARHAD
jgi:carboxylesterase